MVGADIDKSADEEVSLPMNITPDRAQSLYPETMTQVTVLPGPPPRDEAAGGTARPMLWREAVGHQFRAERLRRRHTLADVATDAGVSTQYLSEVERGRKEPSSEIVAAVATALGLDLSEVADRVSRALRSTADHELPTVSGQESTPSHELGSTPEQTPAAPTAPAQTAPVPLPATAPMLRAA